MNTAEKKWNKFANHIKRLKKVPKPPEGLMALNDGIEALRCPSCGEDVNCHVGDCTNEEKRFLIKEARKLGFKPRWDK